MDEDVMDGSGLPAQSAGGSSVNASPHRPEARGFTPGPWQDDSYQDTPDGRHIIWTGAEVVADIGMHSRSRSERNAANAALITAAPDLYKALDMLAAAVDRMSDPNEAGECFDLLPYATDALARANGEAIPSTSSTSSPRTAKQTQES